MTIEDLALLFVRGLGSRGAAHLVDHFGTAEAVYGASLRALCDDAGLRESIAEQIVAKVGFEEAEREIAYCRKHRIIPLAATDDDYPEPLRETPDRPHVLFVRGSIDALHGCMLSVVGTRDMSPSGLHVTNMLVENLASRVDNLCIVSGLAYGVDAASHRAALANGVRTVAVIAGVLPEVSPTAHNALAEDILKHGGALVSELHSATKQRGIHYLARNRIIAGMTMGTLVVESPASGGSLATADMADGYGRTVMAVPGRATDSSSFGTNNLIRTGKARLVLTAEDIMEDMGWCSMPRKEVVEYDVASGVTDDALTPAQRATLDAFDSAATLDWPMLMSATGLTMGELSMVVMELELMGLIRTLPGKRYERV